MVHKTAARLFLTRQPCPLVKQLQVFIKKQEKQKAKDATFYYVQPMQDVSVAGSEMYMS